MKNVFFAITLAISLLSILLLTVGCKDADYFEKGTVLPKEYKTSPMMISLTSSPDFTFPQGMYVPEETGGVVLSAGGWMHGFASSIYHVDADKSHFVFKKFALGSNPYELTSTFEGMLTQENGDSFRYKGVIVTQLLRSTFGEFLPNGECTWVGDGTISLYY